jgi:23S rRNA pseudouridine1911/1915/1917 synthase
MVKHPIAFEIGPEDAGQRLDKLVIAHVPGAARRSAARLFATGAVALNGRRVSKGTRASAGDRIVVTLDEELSGEPEAELAVRLETPHLVIVSKPAGQPTAPLHSSEIGTLAGALLGHYPELSGIGYHPLEPGLIHRLDNQTSGLLIAARSASSFEMLRAALKRGEIVKRYLAIVEATELEETGTIELPLEPDPHDRRRVRVALPGAAPARFTRFDVRHRTERWALLEIESRRAYRHQVRAHLAAMGCPIVGDNLYGGPKVAALGTRHALHASHVAWTGNSTIPSFAVDDALPKELASLLEV